MREVELVIDEGGLRDDVDDALFQRPLGNHDVVPRDAHAGEIGGGTSTAEERLAQGEAGGGRDVVGKLVEDAEVVARPESEVVTEAEWGGPAEPGGEVVEAVDAPDGQPHPGGEGFALGGFVALHAEVEDGVKAPQFAGHALAGDARLEALDFDGKIPRERRMEGALRGEPEQGGARNGGAVSGEGGEREEDEEEKAGVQNGRMVFFAQPRRVAES